MNAALVVFLGGGLGSLFRYGISKASLYYFSSSFPLGTFLANILSCVLLAVVILLFHFKANTELKALQLFLITGFCGGLSTFSAFSFETMTLLKNQMWGLAVFNVGLSLLVGIAAMYFILLKTN